VWVLNGSGGGVVSCNNGNGVVIFFFFCNSDNGSHFFFSDGSFSLRSHLPLRCCYGATSLVVHTMFNANGLGANTMLLGVEFYGSYSVQC